MAAKALGLMDFANLGDPTKEEIDGLLAILLDLQKTNGHIRAFWRSEFTESVELMASGESVVIESMYQPAASGPFCRRSDSRCGTHCRRRAHAVSPEASSHLGKHQRIPATLQACYDFINWWYSGFPGAVMMRQSFFYYAVQETSRAFVEPGEYAYWIEGAPADRDYPGPFGDVSIHKGDVREGASLAQQACRVAVWGRLARGARRLLARELDEARGGIVSASARRELRGAGIVAGAGRGCPTGRA